MKEWLTGVEESEVAASGDFPLFESTFLCQLSITTVLGFVLYFSEAIDSLY